MHCDKSLTCAKVVCAREESLRRMVTLRRGRRRQRKKLYAAGYLQSPQQGGVKRQTVLAVFNVVGAIGLLSLISYGFFSDRLQGAAESDAGLGHVAKLEFSIESTHSVTGLPSGDVSLGGVAVASLGPRLRGARLGASAGNAPMVTGSIARSGAAGRVSTPGDAEVLRATLIDDFGGAGLAPEEITVGGDVRRVVIGSGKASETPEAPVRLASLGSFSDLLPTRAPDAVDAKNLSFGSLFREPEGRVRGSGFDAIPAPTRVPLVRRGEAGAVLMMSLAAPPFQVRDVKAETRGDLIEAEEAARRKTIVEKEPIRDRRLARERYCLAAAVYYEARGEPHNGQQAVAQVVLNRVEDGRYPSTVCGVVFQDENRKHRCQFSFACDGKPERPKPGASWTQSLDIARDFLEGFIYAPVVAATHYHADYVSPRWSRSSAMTRVRKIGNHIFYTES